MASEIHSARDFFPSVLTLKGLAAAAEGCTACPLYRRATQVVFGEGLKRSLVMLVGEQPGDREDRQGRPFVGPAGRLLDDTLAAAGIDRRQVYLTNVVKHFKWKPRGKRRIHDRPGRTEISACLPWLEAEIEVVEPRMLVCLGAVAAQTLLGRDFRITRRRGEVIESRWAPWTMATYHPSAVLRAPDEAREAMRAELLHDFETLAGRYRELAAG